MAGFRRARRGGRGCADARLLSGRPEPSAVEPRDDTARKRRSRRAPEPHAGVAAAVRVGRMGLDACDFEHPSRVGAGVLPEPLSVQPGWRRHRDALAPDRIAMGPAIPARHRQPRR